jgi:hypothetical protein
LPNEIRNRTKEYFPTVLLTLLSIVQAIALELLWGKVVSIDTLYSFSIMGVLGWIQIAATLLGIVLIWLVYAGNVMRFRWVPNLADSTYPFLVGILEFWLVENLGPGTLGFWFVAMGFTFALMTWVSQITMRKSRYDADNAHFFDHRSPATLKDFLPQISITLLLVVCGTYLISHPPDIWFQAVLLVLILLFLASQCVSTARYWEESLKDTQETLKS